MGNDIFYYFSLEVELSKNIYGKNLSPNLIMIIAVQKWYKMAISRKTGELKAL